MARSPQDILNPRRRPKAAPASPDTAGGNGKPAAAPLALTERPPDRITACDLFAKEFPPVPFVVEGLVGPGVTVLAGKPKGGKSWLALLVAWAVAAGQEIDGRAVNPGEVLYLALEDTERRLQSRLKSLHAELGWVVPETLTIATAWPRADDNGLQYVAEWLAAHNKRARLVIVDVLAKWRKPQKGNVNSYADDYEAVGGLKQYVDLYGASAIFVHHTRKLKAEDPFDEVSGTYGISGQADTLWVLDRHETGHDARLYVRGRDVAECTVPMCYTPGSGRWVLGASKEGIDTEGRGLNGVGDRAASKVDQCAAWLKEFLREFAFPSAEIAEAAAKAGYTFSSLRDAKAKLGKNGTRELVSRNFGGDDKNDWWCGLGPPGLWKLRVIDTTPDEPVPE